MLSFILTYSYRKLIFMYIFGYLFQKGNFQGSSKKGHIDKNFWEEGGWQSLWTLCSEGPALKYVFS